jgi:uncharacterized protein (TIGR03086 family)
MTGMTGAETLRQAVRYALAAAEPVTPPLLARPTPCLAWDLRALLVHASESLDALAEGLTRGTIALLPAAIPPDQIADPALAFRRRASALLATCRAGDADGQAAGQDTVTIAGCPLATGLMIAAGAIEVAVHGWDMAAACGGGQQIPDELAAELLGAAGLLIGAAGRAPHFGPPVAVPAGASASDRLTAFLGRSPRPLG